MNLKLVRDKGLEFGYTIIVSDIGEREYIREMFGVEIYCKSNSLNSITQFLENYKSRKRRSILLTDFLNTNMFLNNRDIVKDLFTLSRNNRVELGVICPNDGSERYFRKHINKLYTLSLSDNNTVGVRECTCGAAFTSNPTFHYDWCDLS